MRSISKILSLFLAVALFVSSMSLPASAVETEYSEEMKIMATITTPDGSVSNYTFNGRNMTWSLCDENGDPVATPYVVYNNIDIPNGYRVTFRNESGDDFYLLKGSRIQYTIWFNTPASFIMGYTRSGGSSTTLHTQVDAKQLHISVVTIPSTGRYNFWVTNTSTDTKNLYAAQVTDL